MVCKLRDLTNFPLDFCKEAAIVNGNDTEKAIKWMFQKEYKKLTGKEISPEKLERMFQDTIKT